MSQVTQHHHAGHEVAAQAETIADAGFDFTPWDSELLVVRGENRPHLRRQVALLRALLERQPDVQLADLAASLNHSLPEGGTRLGLVASSVEQLAKHLARAAEKLSDLACHQIRDVGGIYFTDKPLYAPGRLAYLFPGEGAQYLNMLGDLGDHFHEVRSFVDHCDALEGDVEAPHANSGKQSRFLFVPKDVDKAQRDKIEQDLRTLGNSIFSVLVADGAIYQLLSALHVRPDAIAGHSAGELGALWAAGAMAEDDFVFQRVADTMFGMEDATDDAQPGVLLAVGAPRDEMHRLVAEAFGDAREQACVFVAMDNCPHQTVLVGLAEDVQRIEAALKNAGRMYERLPVPRPYHTRLFESYMGPINAMFDGVNFSRPHTKIYSATTGELFPDDPAEIRRLALSHWASPVEFTKMIRTMHDDGVRLFVEVGPRGNLTAFVEDILRGREHLAVPANLPRRSGVTQIHHLAAQLACHGVPLNLAHLDARRQVRTFDPFEGRRSASKAIAPPPATSTAALPPRFAPELAPHTALEQPGTSAATRPSAPTSTPAGARPSSHVGRAAVVGEYWDVMEQFLATQQSVMQQYFQRRAGTPAHAVAPQTLDVFSRLTPPPAQPPFPPQPADAVGSPAAQPAIWPPAVEALPMLGEILHVEPRQSLVMRRRLDLAEDLYAGDHTVGGRSISNVDPNHFGLPIGPMTFTLELMAETASALLPGLVVVGIRNVRLQRWLAFETEDPNTVECNARLLTGEKVKPEPGVTHQVQVEVKDLGNTATGDQKWTAAVGVVLLADRYPEPPPAEDFPLTREFATTVTVDEMYNDLFHGDVFRGVWSLDRSGEEGIESRVEVLPRKGLLRSTDDPQFLTDPVLMDVVMHPLAAWHLEQVDRAGRVLLPFEMTRVSFYGPRPEVGTQFHARGRIQAQSSRHFVHGVDVVGADGRLWCKLDGAKYWRFYLPFGDVNFHGRKDEYFISQPWPRALPPRKQQHDERGPTSFCVKLDVPPDLQNAAMLQVSAQITLAPDELREFKKLKTTDKQKSDWVFGRMAAKDAARQLWFARNGQRLYPADIAIDHDEHGRPSARNRAADPAEDFPHVSLSHTDGLLAGLASTHPHVGIDVEKIAPREASFEQVAFDAEERRLLEQFADRDEAVTRLWCAKEAVAKAVGRGLSEGTHSVVARHVDPPSGLVLVELGAALAKEFPKLAGARLQVATLREKDYVVATTFCERHAP
ncbi:MAG: polyketide synthase dehydratase domain-containing protein [Pirellulaceae bacterium]